MLCTVSTVKDSRANIEEFVADNLSSGADHMFVFLEADDDGAHEFLLAHPHVTPVLTDDAYWRGARPPELVQRQMVNANLVNCLVSALPRVEWLAHIDGDECLDIDKLQLVALGSEVRCVRLGVLEAVSTEHGTRPAKYFKVKLMPDQLEMLANLGAIEAPQNQYYLFGHLSGKAAVRPGLDLDLGVHRAVRRSGEPIEHLKGPGFRVLHYDSVSFAEFVRKWRSHLAGGATNFREERRALVREVSTVLSDRSADEETRVAALRDVYKRRVEDPVDLLRSRKLLVERPRDRHAYRPLPFPAEDRAALQGLLRRLLTMDKRPFRSKAGPDATVRLMLGVRDGLANDDPSMAARIERSVQAACSTPHA